MIRKVTRVFGGYGRSGRVLRVTLPSRIGRAMSIKRGDSIEWKLSEHGQEAVVTLIHRGELRSQKTRPKPVARGKEAIDYLLEGMEEQAEEIIIPTEKIL